MCAAVILLAVATPSAAANTETDDDGTSAIIDASTPGDNTLEVGATSAPVTYDPNAPAAEAADYEGGGASEPYEEAAPPEPMPCDALFDDGTIGNCPPGIPEIAEEAVEDEDDLTPADVQAAILTAFQSLPVAGSPITYQPEGDWALVNMDFIVYTDTATQNLGTTILGVPVTFELTPTHWTWDFGDGTTMPSSNPGAAYPNHTLSHVYSSAHDGVTVSLTTLWSGEFQIGGAGDWYPVDGFVTTTSTTGPIEIVAMDVHLVPNDT